ncbi:MAG: isochorismate synthase [Acidobacteria bacterium]|nr:isochorismate synthase [Acidobacteriota bacterium]
MSPQTAFSYTATELGRGIDPLDHYRRWTGEPFRFYWEHPPTGTAIAARGVVASFDRTALIDGSTNLGTLVDDVDSPTNAPAPLLVGGFRFDPDSPTSASWTRFGDGKLVLPTETVMRRDGRSWRFKVDAAGTALGHTNNTGSTTSIEQDYVSQVRDAVELIDSSDLDKVVVARAIDIRGCRDEVAMLGRMRTRNPGCVTFAVGIDDTAFVGATPELLVRVRHGRVAAGALAGTARRRHGTKDSAIASDLRNRAKELDEHRYVVDDIVSALDTHGVEVDPVPEPTVMTLTDLHHLYTPISGHANGTNAAQLALAMHPSAAVCGTPTAVAKQWIRANEHLDRGWYAAPIGYIDTDGDGEFRVALRSALIEPTSARLFAGAGIVHGSNPEAEYQETEVKLRPMLDAIESR